MNDRLAWVGFDVAEVVMLAVTAYLAWRGRAKVALAATALATMLVVDAWFDVNTSTAGEEREIALGFAVLEVSLAAVSVWIAFHAASVARRRLEDLARRDAVREIRRTLPSPARPGGLMVLTDWAPERPSFMVDVVGRSRDGAGGSAGNDVDIQVGPAEARRGHVRSVPGSLPHRVNSAARAPRMMSAASDARSQARKYIRRYVPDKRHPAESGVTD